MRVIINKGNFAKEYDSKKHYSCTFFKEVKRYVFSCLRRLSAWPSLLTSVESQWVSIPGCNFSNQAYSVKPVLAHLLTF